MERFSPEFLFCDTSFAVGPHRWVNPNHSELKMLLRERLEEYFSSAKPDLVASGPVIN
jgi:hypothetical protein